MQIMWWRSRGLFNKLPVSTSHCCVMVMHTQRSLVTASAWPLTAHCAFHLGCAVAEVAQCFLMVVLRSATPATFVLRVPHSATIRHPHSATVGRISSPRFEKKKKKNTTQFLKAKSSTTCAQHLARRVEVYGAMQTKRGTKAVRRVGLGCAGFRCARFGTS